MEARINDTTIWYDTLGAGPPLLLLHGGPGLDHTEFRPWLDPLADQFKLIFVDERGTGRSARVDPATATTDQMVEDIESLRQQLGLDQIALLGFSFGGFLAQAYAIKYSRNLSHLLLIDTAPSNEFAVESDRLVSEWASPEIKAALDNEPNLTSDAEFLETFKIEMPVYFKQWGEREQQIGAAMTRDLLPGFEVMTWWFNNELPRYDLRSQLGAIDVPALVVVGRADRITPPVQAEEIARHIRGARLELFENSGHMTIAEEQERFIALVREFVG